MLHLLGAFFPTGGFKNGLAGPASTGYKSLRVVFQIVMVTPRGLLIYMRGLAALGRRPRIVVWSAASGRSPPLGGLAVVRVAFLCSVAVEPSRLHFGYLFTAWAARARKFDFRALFQGFWKDLLPSLLIWLRARFW